MVSRSGITLFLILFLACAAAAQHNERIAQDQFAYGNTISRAWSQINSVLSPVDREMQSRVNLVYDRNNFNPFHTHTNFSENTIYVTFGMFSAGVHIRQAIATHLANDQDNWQLEAYFRYLFVVAGDNLARSGPDDPIYEPQTYVSYFDVDLSAHDEEEYIEVFEDLVVMETFFVLAHELGHLIRPRQSTIRQEEMKADAFAFDLLNRFGYPPYLAILPSFTHVGVYQSDLDVIGSESRHPAALCRIGLAMSGDNFLSSDLRGALSNEEVEMLIELSQVCPNF
jgi:hypothetical protein